MIYFYVLKNVRVTSRGARQVIHFKAPPQADINSRRISPANIYFTTHAQFERLVRSIPDAHSGIRVIDDLAVDAILNKSDYPREITYYRHGEINHIYANKSKTVKIAIINGMGNGIGDSIVGLRALDIFYQRLQANYSTISLDMFQRVNPELHTLYQYNKAVNQTYDMPQTVARLLTYDYLMSLEAFTLSQEFNSMPMIDYFLAKLGIDPVNITDNEKGGLNPNLLGSIKNSDKVLESLIQMYKSKRHRLLLIHLTASDALRSVPGDYVIKLIDYLISNTDFILVSAIDINYKHERLLDLSSYSNNVETFATIISCMDAVITVDTSTYHIAACFGVPVVVLFNTIYPQYRVSYYPNVSGVWLGKGMGQLFMRHKGFTEQDKILLDSIYRKLDYENLLGKLNSVIKSAQSKSV